MKKYTSPLLLVALVYSISGLLFAAKQVAIQTNISRLQKLKNSLDLGIKTLFKCETDKDCEQVKEKLFYGGFAIVILLAGPLLAFYGVLIELPMA